MKERKINYSFLRYYLNKNDNFKKVYIFIIALVLYGSFALVTNHSSKTFYILKPFNFYIFNILFYLLSFYNILCVYNYFRDYAYSLLFRYQNKKKMLIFIFKNVFNVYLIFTTIFTLLFFSIIMLFYNFDPTFTEIIHIIFFLLKFFIIYMGINLITFIVYLFI